MGRLTRGATSSSFPSRPPRRHSTRWAPSSGFPNSAPITWSSSASSPTSERRALPDTGDVRPRLRPAASPSRRPRLPRTRDEGLRCRRRSGRVPRHLRGSRGDRSPQPGVAPAVSSPIHWAPLRTWCWRAQHAQPMRWPMNKLTGGQAARWVTAPPASGQFRAAEAVTFSRDLTAYPFGRTNPCPPGQHACHRRAWLLGAPNALD